VPATAKTSSSQRNQLTRKEPHPFENAGLNVDEATVRLPSSVHQAAHDVGWNAAWEDFFGANPNPSGAEIVNQASHMMWEFGLDRYSLGVEPYG
jgi:hypothetical protein